MDGVSNGCILCSIVRFKNDWGIQPRGYYTINSHIASEVLPCILKVMKNDFSLVKVMDHDIKSKDPAF